MSWKDAQRAAERWIESLKLPKVRGVDLDLENRTEGLPEIAEFRQMVLEAAHRVLKKQGARSIRLPK